MLPHGSVRLVESRQSAVLVAARRRAASTASPDSQSASVKSVAWLPGMLALSLWLLADIPLTARFIGMFYATTAGVDAGLWWLVLVLIANSVVSLYYYLRLFVTLFGEAEEPATVPQQAAMQRPEFVNWTTVCSLGFVASIILVLGVYPEPVIHLIRDSVSNLLMVVAQRP